MSSWNTPKTLLLIAAFLLAFYGLAALDAFESFYHFSRTHESWELDELALLVPALLFTSLVFISLQWNTSRNALKTAMQSKEELQETLFLNKNILSHAPVGVSVFEAQTGELIMVNETLTHMIGALPTEEHGMNFRQLESWKSSGLLALAEETLATGKVLRMVLNTTNSFGKDIVLDCTCSTFSADKQYLLVTASDISIQMQAEDDLYRMNTSLRESEENYKSLFENAPVGIVMSTLEGEIISFNQQLLDLFGYSRGEFPHVHMTALYQDPGVRKSLIERLVQDEKVLGVPLHLKRKDERKIVVESSLHLIPFEGRRCVLTCLQDVTKRFKAREALRESEERYRLLFDSANDAIFLEQGDVFIDCNHKTVEMFGGTSKDDFFHKRVSDFSPATQPNGEDSATLAMSYITKTLSGEPQRFEWRGKKLDGGFLDVEVSLNRIELDRKPHIMAITRDISTQKQTEQDLRDARDAAESASRAKSEFLANMSHELRTPLNGVLGMLQLVEDANVDSEAREWIDSAQEAAKKLLAIINDILSLTQSEGAEGMPVTQFTLADIVVAASLAHQSQAEEKGLSFTTNYDEGAENILLGDKARIDKIVFCLLDNAVKYTAAGGVTLSVWLTPAPTAANPRQSRLHIEVADTGPGVPQDNLETIFAPFTQGDGSFSRPHGGIGLGLTIVKRFVELLGGEIIVENREGRGATFSLFVHVRMQAGEA